MTFRRSYFFTILLALICAGCKGQNPSGTNLLVKQAAIPMPGIKGRIDHLDINLKEKIVYIAALGNNSLEVVDIGKGKVLKTIIGLNEPQGVAYISQQQEIFVANGGNGDCYFYNAHSFEKTATIHLSSDADDVRYDSIDEKIYVGYGEGGIAIIDSKQHKQVGNIKLSAHPEGFQLDKKMNKIFINVPDAHQIAIGDLSSFELISTWSTGELRSNFPLAIDTISHMIFIGYRRPAKLVLLDGVSGNTFAIEDLVNDTDDIFFDERENKIYASGGGFITIYQWKKPEIKQIAKIYTRDGARTSLFVPALKLFILAARANNNNNAELQVYEIKATD